MEVEKGSSAVVWAGKGEKTRAEKEDNDYREASGS